MLSAVLLNPGHLPPPPRQLGRITFEIVDDLARFAARIERGAVDLFVIGEAVSRPVEVAQTVHQLAEELGIAILCRRERIEGLRSAIRFSPFLANIECVVSSGWDTCGPTLEAIALATKRRRQHRAWLNAAERSVTALPDVRVRPARVLDQFLKCAPIGVVLLTPEGIVVAANPRASEILGAPGRHFAGQRLTELLPDFARDALGHLSERTLHGPGVVREVCGGTLCEGRQQYLSLSAAAVLPDAGERLVLLLLEDVTERVHSENLLREACEDLRRRTENLIRTNAALLQFTTVASHDLQEPLRVVESYLRILERRYGESLDASGKEFLRYAVDGAAQMAQLVRDLLEYSRSGGGPALVEPVDCATLLETVRRGLGLRLEQTGATVEWDTLPVVDADRAQLSRVFQNLLGNALKFTTPGRLPEVRVSARDSGHEWVFSVSDNGIGVPEGERSGIFQLFRRLHSDRGFPGTGIGLAVCRQIVEGHGGRIWLDSTPGEGSIFYFTLAKNPCSRLHPDRDAR